MALFHLSVTQTKRSAGQSAIASAAYRAGERLYSEYYGESARSAIIKAASKETSVRSLMAAQLLPQ